MKKFKKVYPLDLPGAVEKKYNYYSGVTTPAITDNVTLTIEVGGNCDYAWQFHITIYLPVIPDIFDSDLIPIKCIIEKYLLMKDYIYPDYLFATSEKTELHINNLQMNYHYGISGTFTVQDLEPFVKHIDENIYPAVNAVMNYKSSGTDTMNKLRDLGFKIINN